MRSERSGQSIPLSNLVQVSEIVDSKSLNRWNRLRSITIEANLDKGLSLGAALDHLEGLARAQLPEQARIDDKGQSRDFRQAGSGVLFASFLGALVV